MQIDGGYSKVQSKSKPKNMRQVPRCICSRDFVSGLEQSMKPMIGKSIDQSMTIDALLVNWHRLASANR